ncbi:MAG: sigma-54-dependent Fis family transcriptional regulator [Candidatus Brocadiae bacterium]|nr:sigma-54-dependent Fis family transcriptional regulator [Candidatus Brocadiia bacterium]
MARILIAEDTPILRESVTEALTRAGHEVRAFADGRGACEEARRWPPDAALTDLKMAGMDGIQVVEELLRAHPGLPVIVMTAYGTVETAVDAMRRGAFHFIQKPFKAQELELLVRRALDHGRLSRENEVLRAQVESGTVPLIGLEGLREQLRRIAAADTTVLIAGETGVGKEVVARTLHAESPRAAGPFLAVNCAALSAGLLESELFGHEKGAFTGADRQRKGRFELAEGGTLLLDEVSEMDTNLQAKLLRVLQERVFERVGSSLPRPANVRVVATTNRDLKAEIAKGRFREDLFFRLNVVPLSIPPLRERPEDLEPLCARFLRGRRTLDRGALEILRRYPWPGNVRELFNVLERACVLVPGPTILAEHIAPWLTGSTAGDAAPGTAADPYAGLTMEEIEKRAIVAALAASGGNRQRAATALGIGERTLREKVKKWGLA